MHTDTTYDCAIIGGGLAGLCLAIQLAGHGYAVVLAEKGSYPFHKVCGEYISNESRGFLERMGVPLTAMNVPQIDTLGVSSTGGFMLEAPLRLGGFGISRYTLDATLCAIARDRGVTVLENCKVHDVNGVPGEQVVITSQQQAIEARVVCGSYGKHSPVFMKKDIPATTNYMAVKYHINTALAANRIELHNFRDGYCGISKVDGDRYCLCYLTTASSLKAHNNDIKQLETDVLMKNPFLRRYFQESEFLFQKPLTISGITFQKKDTDSNGLFLLGDAAGAIAPLCGNGMSMGMRASGILASVLHRHLSGKLSYAHTQQLYHTTWNKTFASRIAAGGYLQQLLGHNKLTDLSLKMLKHTPGLLHKIITLTHGQPF
jgi:flavin-dependent dehydrogenase